MNRIVSRRLRGVAAVFALLGFMFAGAVVRAAPSSQGTVISIKGFAFNPPTINVPVGASVTWRNEDPAPHTATANDNTFDTGRIESGQEKTVTLATAGTFEYICAIHPRMTGTIVVGDAQAQPSAAPSTSAAPSAGPYPSEEGSAAPSAAGGPTPSLTVRDQAIVNGTITIAQVVAAQDGWVAVHTFDANGQLVATPPGGLAAVKAGTTTNLSIKLDQSFPAGAKLAPMLHIDAGTLGTYEFPNGPDTPVQANGQVVMTPITVQAAAASAAAPPAAPSALPNTGVGDRTPYALLIAAAVTLLAGIGITARLRRRTAR